MKPVFGTFGIYRWFLACMVLLAHTGPQGSIPPGMACVYGFYILTGYVVTYMMDTRYLHMEHGIARFYLNRALRIYPAYWCAVIATFAFARHFPDAMGTPGDPIGTRVMFMPSGGIRWLINLLALDHLILIPTFSLSIEITWWLLLPFIISNFSYTRIYALVITGYFTMPLYTSVLGAMLPVSLGILLYHRKLINYPDLPDGIGAACGGLLLLYLYLSSRYFSFSAGVVFNALFIYYLSGIDTQRLAPFLRRVDTLFGELAYPLFLLNGLSNGMAARLIPMGEKNVEGWGLFAVCFIIAHIMALIIVYTIEIPMNKVRQRVRA